MKISEITPADVMRYLRLGGEQPPELVPIMAAAQQYIAAYTGIPIAGDGDTLDDYPDFWLAYMVLCQDMYDNRAYVQENSGRLSSDANLVVENILGLHARNLL